MYRGSYSQQLEQLTQSIHTGAGWQVSVAILLLPVLVTQEHTQVQILPSRHLQQNLKLLEKSDLIVCDVFMLCMINISYSFVLY